jgi:hypothetical protein
MKKTICAIYALLFITSIVIGQIPILSLDATKGFNTTTWQDQSGNNNHISLGSTSKTTDGVYFDGNNSAMLSNPIPLSNFTIYMTVKVQELGKTLLGNGQPSEYGLHYQDNALYSATDQPFSVFNSSALTLNKSIVITLSRDVSKNEGNVSLYIDGAPVGTFASAQKKTFNLTNLTGEIGYLFKGWMKNVAIYNEVHDITRIKNISSGIVPSGSQTGSSAGLQGTIEVSDQIYADVLASFPISRISNANKAVFTIEVWKVKYENGQKGEGVKRQPINVLLQSKVANANVTTTKVSGAIKFTITNAPMDGNHIILAYFNNKPAKYTIGDINGKGDDGSGRTLEEVIYRADVKKKIGMDKVWGLYSLRPNTDKNNIVFKARMSDGTDMQNMNFWDDVVDFFEDVGDAIIGLAGVVANGVSSFFIQVGTATYTLFAEGEEPRHKLLTEEEYKWANDKIFNGTLPSRGTIIVTNLIGIGGRQYTIPNGFGQTYMNMGSGGYKDPMNFARPNEIPGQLLIHELTHAWQIEYNTGLKAMGEGISNQWKYSVEGDKTTYQYTCGKEWKDYNFEQQGMIVEKCFVKRSKGDYTSCEQQYVENNVRKNPFPPFQLDWRFCNKCQSLFFDGYPQKGNCSAGGTHIAEGYKFAMPYNTPETSTAQTKWRFCDQCYDMFYDGTAEKGACSGGHRQEISGEHDADGYNFSLPHSGQENSKAQANWRYCNKCFMLFFDGYPDKGVCAKGSGHTSVGLSFQLPHSVAETNKAQAAWKFCTKCKVMFYDGYPKKGSCAAGGGHTAAGFNFVLPFNIPETNKMQNAWRFCHKCNSMFYDGYPQKGACPAGGNQVRYGGHKAAGYYFTILHDVPEKGNVQASWRYCYKCKSLFFDGYPKKGVCAGGGGHIAQGNYNFVLDRHD